MPTSLTGVGPVTGPPILSGEGSPEGVYTAPVGGLYRRLDGGVATTLYIKESGTDDTGWTPYGAPKQTMTAGFKYGNSAVLTMTLASLAHSLTAGWCSAAVDNSVDNYMDVMFQLKFRLVAGTPSSDQLVYIYGVGSENGTTFPEGNGTSALLTHKVPVLMTTLQTISATAAGGLTYIGNVFTIAPAFGGIIPRKWCLFVKNSTGLAFTASASENEMRYTGLTVLNQ